MVSDKYLVNEWRQSQSREQRKSCREARCLWRELEKAACLQICFDSNQISSLTWQPKYILRMASPSFYLWFLTSERAKPEIVTSIGVSNTSPEESVSTDCGLQSGWGTVASPHLCMKRRKCTVWGGKAGIISHGLGYLEPLKDKSFRNLMVPASEHLWGIKIKKRGLQYFSFSQVKHSRKEAIFFQIAASGRQRKTGPVYNLVEPL